MPKASPPTSSAELLQRERALMRTATRPPIVMVRGEGSYLWDAEGRRYLDFVQGWAVNAFGHCPELLQRALREQSAQLVTPSPAYYNAPQLELAAELTRLAGLERVCFCSIGSEANEGAIKLARKWGQLHRKGATEIVTTEGAFHGRTLATMAASGKPGWDELFPPRMPGFVRVPFGDVDATERAIGPRTAAVLLEPVQGESGVVPAPEGMLRRLREVCDAHGVLLMLDEIQTGMGRTGPLFAFEYEDVRPDVLTLGKGLGAGYPLAAVLAREEVACFEPGDQGGTFPGNPLACAVGLAVLRALQDPDRVARSAASARTLRSGLEALAARRGCPAVEGRGHLLALVLPEARAPELAAACLERGLLVNAPRPARLRFMPSLVVADEEIHAMLGILDDALEAMLGRRSDTVTRPAPA